MSQVAFWRLPFNQPAPQGLYGRCTMNLHSFWRPAPSLASGIEEAAAAKAEWRRHFEELVKQTGSVDAARRELAVRRAKRRARERAHALGLAYWPALMEDNGVAPEAFLAAERYLARHHGLYGTWLPDGTMCHGGWDSYGHHGLSPQFIAQAWLAAGCKDSPKFRAQLRLHTLASKSDSLQFFLAYARGRRWLNRWFSRFYLSRKAVAALGRLSPELRFAAIYGTQGPDDIRLPNGFWARAPIRIRHLNWAGVRRIQELRRDPSQRALIERALALPPRPAAILLGLPHERGMSHPIEDRRVPDMCPAFPFVTWEVANRVAAGESPVSISGGLLSRKEAHQWLSLGGPPYDQPNDIRESVIAFLSRGLPLESFRPRNVLVARWLRHVHERGAWSALLKVERHPDGRQIRRIDKLDEVDERDLDRGISTGVERAFVNSARRHANHRSEDTTVICNDPFGRLPRAMSLLRSRAALAYEGQVMEHCVGGYDYAVANGECYIISVVSRYGRSTVELRPGRSWTAAQHYGRKNSTPPRRHDQLVRAWLHRINRRTHGQGY